jgi:hypothetical protein
MNFSTKSILPIIAAAIVLRLGLAPSSYAAMANVIVGSTLVAISIFCATWLGVRFFSIRLALSQSPAVFKFKDNTSSVGGAICRSFASLHVSCEMFLQPAGQFRVVLPCPNCLGGLKASFLTSLAGKAVELSPEKTSLKIFGNKSAAHCSYLKIQVRAGDFAGVEMR